MFAPQVGKRRVTSLLPVSLLQASGELFQKKNVPRSINKMLPDAKLMASLRNPVDAFVSKWLQTIKSDPTRVAKFEAETGKAFDCDNVFHEQRIDFKRCAFKGSVEVSSFGCRALLVVGEPTISDILGLKRYIL